MWRKRRDRAPRNNLDNETNQQSEFLEFAIEFPMTRATETGE